LKHLINNNNINTLLLYKWKKTKTKIINNQNISHRIYARKLTFFLKKIKKKKKKIYIKKEIKKKKKKKKDIYIKKEKKKKKYVN